MTEARELFNTVIVNGYCIGCGVCASKESTPFGVKMNEYGNIVAYAKENLDTNKIKVLKTCPFSNYSKNETILSGEFFSHVKERDQNIGAYLKNYAGYVKEGEYRKKGSSGGIAKWIGYQLMKMGKIDQFIQLVPNSTNNPELPLFDYAVFTDKETILDGSKSAYYPTTLINIINHIKSTDGRYAITGVPCAIKAIRLLSIENEIIKQRIRYTVGIICGGMKSANHSKLVAWEQGVEPQNLSKIDFRKKYIDRPASQKIYEVWSNKDTKERYKNAGEIYGTDYGAGFFKPLACDYCDDVVGETADISIGDAWLPQFVNDPQGTSIMVVRNSDIHDILKEGSAVQEIFITQLSASDVARSQQGGFRHRREGLSLRLANRSAEGKWVPIKRVLPNQYKLSNKRKRIYSLREEIAIKSHLAFLTALNNKNLDLFHKEMDPLVVKYRKVNKVSIINRLLSTVERKLKKFKKIIGTVK